MASFLVVFSFYLFKLDKKTTLMVEFNEIIYILIFIVQINLTSAPFHHLNHSVVFLRISVRNDSFK